MYYGDYLQLNKILQAQDLESDKLGAHAHDEMLFIVIHQAYELWFKQILFELESIHTTLSKPTINDNSPEMFAAVHRMKRINEIMKVLVEQINILETMTPLDFLDFRDMLRPASGFQSVQFKVLETILGLRIANRHGKEYFLSQLRPDDVAAIRQVENRIPVTELLNKWLERMPFFHRSDLWEGGNAEIFWQEYRNAYSLSLGDGEKQMLNHFDNLMMTKDWNEENRTLSTSARRAALFINLYRDLPLLQLPFRLIDSLLELDELMAIWRFRHVNMVSRMIGHRVGTGGSSGKEYLRSALDKHYIFQEYAELTSLQIERRKLPLLSAKLEQTLGYSNG